MNDQYWGWILSVLGLVGFYVTGKKIWWGWWLNVAAQAVWYAYAIATQQWGFLVMTTMYTVIFTKNAIAWTKEHRSESKEWDLNEYSWQVEEMPDQKGVRVEGEGDILEHEFVVDALGYKSEEEMQARVEAQVQGWLDELPQNIARSQVDVYMGRSMVSPNFYTFKAVVRK